MFNFSLLVVSKPLLYCFEIFKIYSSQVYFFHALTTGWYHQQKDEIRDSYLNYKFHLCKFKKGWVLRQFVEAPHKSLPFIIK